MTPESLPWSSFLEDLPLRVETPPEWAAMALRNLDRVLVDHAFCEHKAASSALAIIARYPGFPQLVRPMLALAQEELHHLRQVLDQLDARGLELGAPRPDRYVGILRERFTSEGQGIGGLGDLLLVNAFIEARSSERFRQLAAALVGRSGAEGELGTFYRRLASAEGRHWELFRDLAGTVVAPERVARRIAEVAEFEREVIQSLPLEPRMH